MSISIRRAATALRPKPQAAKLHAMARKKKSRGKRWLRFAAVALGAWIIVSVTLVLPLRWFEPATSSFMLSDQSGRIPVAYDWQPLSEISESAALAVVAAEDQRFLDHAGFDLASIADALEQRSKGESLRGASTLSQQVSKNLFLWSGRSFVRKGVEAYLTLLLEACLPKRRILEIYVNVAEFGPGIYGVPAASRHYFDHEPTRLTDQEAALLAAVLPNPKRLNAARPSDYVRERQAWTLQQMARLRREGWLTQIR